MHREPSLCAARTQAAATPVLTHTQAAGSRPQAAEKLQAAEKPQLQRSHSSPRPCLPRSACAAAPEPQHRRQTWRPSPPPEPPRWPQPPAATTCAGAAAVAVEQTHVESKLKPGPMQRRRRVGWKASQLSSLYLLPCCPAVCTAVHRRAGAAHAVHAAHAAHIAHAGPSSSALLPCTTRHAVARPREPRTWRIASARRCSAARLCSTSVFSRLRRSFASRSSSICRPTRENGARKSCSRQTQARPLDGRLPSAAQQPALRGAELPRRPRRAAGGKWHHAARRPLADGPSRTCRCALAAAAIASRRSFSTSSCSLATASLTVPNWLLRVSTLPRSAPHRRRDTLAPPHRSGHSTQICPAGRAGPPGRCAACRKRRA